MHAAEIPFHDLHTRSGWMVWLYSTIYSPPARGDSKISRETRTERSEAQKAPLLPFTIVSSSSESHTTTTTTTDHRHHPRNVAYSPRSELFSYIRFQPFLQLFVVVFSEPIHKATNKWESLFCSQRLPLGHKSH